MKVIKDIDLHTDIFDQITVSDEIKRQLLAPDLDSIQPKNNLQRCIKAAIEVAQTPLMISQNQKTGSYNETLNTKCFHVLEALLERSIGRYNPFFSRESDRNARDILTSLAERGNIEAIKMLVTESDQEMTVEQAEQRRLELLEKL